jgi:hypothetical protein
VPIMISPARTRIHKGAPVNGSVAAWCADARMALLCPLCASDVATAPGASSPAGFEPGSRAGGVWCGTGRPEFGCGSGAWSGVEVGSGDGAAAPQLPPWRWLRSAWTSTSWRPVQGIALCGWLLPGPWSTSVPAAPFLSAICPAVWPFPYPFVLSDCASACVSCVVSFDGLTPVAFTAVVVAGNAAGVVAVVVVVVVVGGATGGAVSSFFSCPGALAEFPGSLPAFPLPLPFPAYAAPANAKTLRTSTHVLVNRIVILPFPTAHVTGEPSPVYRT